VPLAPPPPTEACPGCGAVLVRLTDGPTPRAGASASCARLFEDTLRGLREDAAVDAGVAAVVLRADSAYELQHPGDGAPRPAAWQTTIADVAADLDVIDLAVLVQTWADAIAADLAAATPPR
jgi:hypothetical protein